jgi:hypothetical protein
MFLGRVNKTNIRVSGSKQYRISATRLCQTETRVDLAEATGTTCRESPFTTGRSLASFPCGSEGLSGRKYTRGWDLLLGSPQPPDIAPRKATGGRGRCQVVVPSDVHWNMALPLAEQLMGHISNVYRYYIIWAHLFFLFFYFKFPNVFAICIHILNKISKLCVEKRGRVEECSVAPLRDKRVKTLCGCRRKRIQTKEKYKLRLTTKAYKLRSWLVTMYISVNVFFYHENNL